MHLQPIARPLSDVRQHTSEVFDELRTTKQPVLVTEHGHSAGVILAPETFNLIKERLEVMEEIALGELDIAGGNHVSWDEVKARLRRWRR